MTENLSAHGVSDVVSFGVNDVLTSCVKEVSSACVNDVVSATVNKEASVHTVLFRRDSYPDWYRPLTAANQVHHKRKSTVTALSIVSHCDPFIVGVDTHARNHVYAILDAANGALLDTQSFPTNAAGINRAITWVARRTNADADTLWVIEGAASYGAILAGTVATHGFPVAEAPRMDAKKNRGVGKTDALDSQRLAMAVLPLPVEKLRRPRLNEGIRQGLRILVTARESMTKDRTRSVNALNALVRSNDLGIDARRKFTRSRSRRSPGGVSARKNWPRVSPVRRRSAWPSTSWIWMGS